MSLVLDASMAIAWYFPHAHGDDIQVALDRVVADGAAVPTLWRLEVANVLRNAVRARRCDKAYADWCVREFSNLSIDVDADTDAHAWGRTRELSNEYDLTVYDAAYLELALRRKLALASCDKELIGAARRARVEVLAG